MTCLRRLLALALALSVAGCYTLQPIRSGPPDVGTSVEVSLTDAGVRTAAAQRDYAQGRTLTGVVLRASGDTLVMRVRRQQRRQFEAAAASDTVAVPYSQVERVQSRQFNAVQTGLLTAGVIGAFTAISVGLFAVEDSGPGGDGFEEPGGDVNLSIP